MSPLQWLTPISLIDAEDKFKCQFSFKILMIKMLMVMIEIWQLLDLNGGFDRFFSFYIVTAFASFSL